LQAPASDKSPAEPPAPAADTTDHKVDMRLLPPLPAPEPRRHSVLSQLSKPLQSSDSNVTLAKV
jgi:hypothetical protein